MSRALIVLASITGAGAVCAAAWMTTNESPPTARVRRPVAVVGDPGKAQRAYDRWCVDFEASGSHRIEIGLGWSRGLSNQYTSIVGGVTVDLDDGRFAIALENLPANRSYDVWMVENSARGRSVAPEAEDRFVRLATVQGGDDGKATAYTSAVERGADVLTLDLLVVTPTGGEPTRDGLAFGTPGLFERRWSRSHARERHGASGSGGLALLSSPSFTPPPTGSTPEFADLVAVGEQLFFEGTFAGNGRTCGSCHPAENNLTLDKEFIEKMYIQNPFDPLFVAEFDPNLMPDFNNGSHFEMPELMHSQGLILENVDGFDDLKNRFVMRGVSHVFAQGLSITRPSGGPKPPKQRTGWAGDGAPGSGQLREFAIGAVRQHFTRTFDRVNGQDFVLPDDGQLDALEAFQLSLGRETDPDITALVFSDSAATAGVSAFLGGCSFCHTNGGANGFLTFVGAATFPLIDTNTPANGNFNTGVERRLHEIIGTNDPMRPVDGGFGVLPIDPGLVVIPGGPIVPNLDGSIGDRTFNSQSIIEAADTVPSFHNNLTMQTENYTTSIEGAIEFYRSSAFAGTPSAILSDASTFTDGDVKNVGRLLRSLNAMENARSAKRYVEQALALGNGNQDEFLVQRALQVAYADAEDGHDVQEQVGLNPASVTLFLEAMGEIEQGQDNTLPWDARAEKLNAAASALGHAKIAIAQ